MLRGIYSAAAGMTTQMMTSDVIADNMANITTPGFKGSHAHFQAFREALFTRLDGSNNQSLGSVAHGSQLINTTYDMSQGDIMETGNPLDVALNGEGFFEVENAATDKMQYTRAGNFTMNGEGQLTTADGSLVQGEGGPITIPRGAKVITISKNGGVEADNVSVGKLKIVQFEHPEQLKRMGGTMYESDETPETVDNAAVQQGMLEKSNSNMITEMVNNMNGMRIYELLQKSIQMQNETLGKAVNEVGRV